MGRSYYHDWQRTVEALDYAHKVNSRLHGQIYKLEEKLRQYEPRDDGNMQAIKELIIPLLEQYLNITQGGE